MGVPPSPVSFRPLESKLRPPRSTQPTVPRRGLLKALQAAKSPMVLVCAAAGAGKTTLLSQWAGEGSLPVAWLQLDGADNDPVRLLVYLALALGRVTTLDREVLTLLGTQMPPIGDVVMPALVEAVGQASPFLLVMDDAHLVVGEPGWQIMTALGVALPEGGHLAIATRSEPPLPLGKLRAGGLISEVTTRDLALDRAEVEEMLALHGLGSDGELSDAVLEATEGWATGVRLSALAQVPPLGAAPSGELRLGRHEVDRYFGSEVLGRQHTDVQEFLLCTSILYRLCPDLCRAVTGRDDAASVLAHLAAENVFLWLLDEEGQWYRYHHVFAQYLQQELQRRWPERVPELHRRAAEWCFADGNVDRAVHHWLAAGDVDQAADHVAAAWSPHVLGGQLATVGSWLRLFSHAQILRHPALALTAGWYFAMSGDPEMGALWRHAAMLEEADGPSPDGAASLRSSRALLRATLGWGGAGQMRMDAELAASLETRPGSSWHATARLILGSALFVVGRPRQAVGSLRAAADESAADYVLVEMGALGVLAILAADEGDWRKAREYGDRAAESFARTRFGEFCPSVVVHAARARVLAEEEEEAGALEELGRARHVLETMVNWPYVALIASVVAGEACLRIGRHDDAALWSAHAQDALLRWPDAGVLRARAQRLEAAVERSRGIDPLSAAEERVLKLLPTQLSFVEIGGRLSLSTNTVKTHSRHIYGKLGVTSRTAAVERARRLGLLGH